MSELLEDAIRAGVARGMDEAPVVPDLAERVRALPSPQRHWKLPLAAAVAVVAVVSIGVAYSIPRTSPNGPLTLPNSSSSSVVRPVGSPPYGTPTTGSSTAANDALGSWAPVWLANYDGPLPAIVLTVQHTGSDGYQVLVKASCVVNGLEAQLSRDGVPSSRHILVSVASCPAPLTIKVPTPFGIRLSTFGRLAVTADGRALTLFSGSGPVMQWAKSSAALGGGDRGPAWSVSGRLPVAAQGTWQYIGGPHDGRVAPVATMTLNPGGTLTGAGGCNNFTGEYVIGVDGRATFTPFTLQNHSCPAGTSPTWQPPAHLARVGISGDRLTMYDADSHVLATFSRL